MGSIFQRGSIYWIKFYRAGKPYRESTHSDNENDAKRLLKSREGQVVDHRFYGLKVERVRFEELAKDVLDDYRINGKKSLPRAERSYNHLKEFFEGIKAVDINTDQIRAYILQRQEEGAENGTVNRELSFLKRMFNLANQMTPPKVVYVPYIPRLQENNIRQGYFEHQEYLALRDALPPYLRPVITMAYNTGMRREEILGLQWSQVDLLEGKVSLKSQDTKNKESRAIFMDGDLLETIRFQKSVRDAKFPKCPWVFFGESGEKIIDFRGSWATAQKTVGIEGRLFHDFRRTAVRNMVRAGVPEKVSMMVSGHKTRSTFERYNITNEEDLKQASKKVVIYHQEKAEKYEQSQNVEEPHGHSLGTAWAQSPQTDLEGRPVIH
jgi:integrase